MTSRFVLSVIALGFFSFSTVLVGCAANTDDSSNDATGSDDSEIRAATLAGTYENPSNENNDLPFYAITFKTDHTYTAAGGCRQDGDGPHCFAIRSFSGTWASRKSGPQLGAPGGAATLVLTDSFDQKNAYFFTLASGTLSLSETFNGKASRFEKHIDAPAGPSGSFAATGTDSLPFYAISFAKDGTFSATGGCRPATTAGAASCHAITKISGSWTTALSGPQLGSPQGAPELVLVDSFDQQSKYFFTLAGKKLSLSTSWGGEASDFTAR